MKKRLSASVSVDLVRAAEQAVREGRAESVSSWVDEAMRQKLRQDERLRALGGFLAAWEAEHGAISDEEVAEAVQDARAVATVVRRTAKGAKPTKAKKRAARKVA